MKRCGVCRLDITDLCLNGACPVGYHNCEDSARPDTDPYEKVLNRSHAVGRAAMLEELAEQYRGMAGACFSRGGDDKAVWYRELAESLEVKAKTARKALEKTR